MFLFWLFFLCELVSIPLYRKSARLAFLEHTHQYKMSGSQLCLNCCRCTSSVNPRCSAHARHLYRQNCYNVTRQVLSACCITVLERLGSFSFRKKTNKSTETLVLGLHISSTPTNMLSWCNQPAGPDGQISFIFLTTTTTTTAQKWVQDPTRDSCWCDEAACRLPSLDYLSIFHCSR